jgi:hypothetical protein
MTKRLVVATLVFSGSVILLFSLQVGPTLLRMYRGRVTGFAFVIGSPVENLARIVILLLLALLAYWLSGKLVKA